MSMPKTKKKIKAYTLVKDGEIRELGGVRSSLLIISRNKNWFDEDDVSDGRKVVQIEITYTLPKSK